MHACSTARLDRHACTGSSVFLPALRRASPGMKRLAASPECERTWGACGMWGADAWAGHAPAVPRSAARAARPEQAAAAPAPPARLAYGGLCTPGGW
eukprot:364298-Chlamydomonas_euryale.AAC.14